MATLVFIKVLEGQIETKRDTLVTLSCYSDLGRLAPRRDGTRYIDNHTHARKVEAPMEVSKTMPFQNYCFLDTSCHLHAIIEFLYYCMSSLEC